MKTKININGKDVEITLTQDQVELIKNSNPLTEVFKFHNTSEEEFEKQYSSVSDFAKHQEVERMIVNYYNKGIQPDFNNNNQVKYYPWFYLGNNFSYHNYNAYSTHSSVSSRLCFLRKEDLLEAVEVFLPQYKNSRNS